MEKRKKVICIIGETGSGKSTIYNYIISRWKRQYNLKRLIYNTTRSKRENEVDDIDYHFVSEDKFYNNTCIDDVIEYRIYNTVDNGKSVYYTHIDNFELDDMDHILVCAGSPDQFIKYIDSIEKIPVNFYTIRICTNIKERVLHLINRCNTDEQVYEALRRMHDEKSDFDAFETSIMTRSKKSIKLMNNYNNEFAELLEDFIKAVSED